MELLARVQNGFPYRLCVIARDLDDETEVVPRN